MEKENKIKKAVSELEKIVKNQSKPLLTIRDVIESIKQLSERGEVYTLLSDTAQFFKKINFKVFEISTYYRIEV